MALIFPIRRALAEKALAQTLGQPTLIALSYTIERRRKDYCAALKRSSKDLEITHWMVYFANTILEAQANTIRRVDYYVAKAKFYERFVTTSTIVKPRCDSVLRVGAC